MRKNEDKKIFVLFAIKMLYCVILNVIFNKKGD